MEYNEKICISLFSRSNSSPIEPSISVIEIVLNMSLIISGGVNTSVEKVSSFNFCVSKAGSWRLRS